MRSLPTFVLPVTGAQYSMLGITAMKIEDTDVPILPEAVALSIAVLGDVFSAMRNILFVWGTAYQTQKQPFDISGGQPLRRWEQLMGFGAAKQIGSDGTERRYPWGDLPMISQRMLEQGWCPSDVAYLDEFAHTISAFYVSHLRRYRRGIQHFNCTQMQCHAYDVAQGYVHDHTTHCGHSRDCFLCRLPLEKSRAIVEAGDIPVVTICNKCPERMSVQPHSQVRDHGFVAISHVWSDGLGNPQETALFECHLHRLQKLANGVQDPPEGENTSFWLDTLCIPLGPPDVGRQAMERMATVYAEASHVLVLDAELEQVADDVPFHEALFRIALSGWNRRLWTLQEGVLAKKLSFQFKGKPRRFDSLYEELIECQIGDNQSPNLFDLRPILQDCMNLNLKHTAIARSTGSKRLCALAQALQHRSCMVPSDEAICLATMLQLDVKENFRIRGNSN
jgi:hypothetical protein